MNGNNLQITPQMLAQAQMIQQMYQQNGSQVPQQNPPMNWNMPTNPMAAMWGNYVTSMMANQNQPQVQQENQQQNIQQTTQPQTNNLVSSVRVVKSPEEIKADEILMNGSISLFLQDDLNVVYGKRWTNNGTIENIRFVREDITENKEEEHNASSENNNINVEELLENISNLVDGKLNSFKKELLASTIEGSNEEGVKKNG